MSRFSRYYFTALLLVSLLLSQGCFYLVEEGKGGVAERFPIPREQWQLSQRLYQCEAAMTEHNLQGKAQLYPALYQHIQMRLMESRRLFKAEYYPQAELMLEPVETALSLMQQGLQSKAEHYLCQLNGNREICL